VDFSVEPFATGYLEGDAGTVEELRRSTLLRDIDTRLLLAEHSEFFIRIYRNGVIFRARTAERDDIPEVEFRIQY
jgi:hypothetical protein